MTTRLRTRITLLALLPTTLVAVLLTSAFLLHAINDLEQGLHTRGTAISRQMAVVAEYVIASGQGPALSTLADATLRSDPAVRGAAIVDADGIIMARSGDLTRAGWPQQLSRLEGLHLEPEGLLFVEPVMRRSLPVDGLSGDTARPPDVTAKVLAHVVTELSLREVYRKSGWLVAGGVMIAILGTTLCGWLAQRIARGVTDPLLEASKVVACITEGDLAARMTLHPAGPLRSLADGINAMAQRIGVTQEELRTRVTDATRDLLREKEAAEHATIAKSHFLAAASHDLRQPLHALGLFIFGLARSEAAKLEPILIAHIQSSVDTLQNLLNAILDISRLDEGKVIPQMGNFPLGALLDRLAGDLSPLAEQKGLRLRVRPTAVWAHSDPKLVERILLNLVGNAVRYTRSGGVLVTCRRRQGVARVEVWDTGKGIPEHARAEIFEEYVQLDNPERDQANGLGLGLSICRRLAGLLAIPIGLRSRPGRGSVFWVDLPLAQETAPLQEPISEALQAQQTKDRARILGTVLVVDSDPLVGAGRAQAILGWGGRVLLAANRAEALRCCQESSLQPDVAICAIAPPEVADGIELAKQLQREFGPMSILLVSPDVGAETQEAARRAGFPLLKEPVPPGRLRAALQHLLSESA